MMYSEIFWVDEVVAYDKIIEYVNMGRLRKGSP